MKEQIKDINQWYADKCGVYHNDNLGNTYWTKGDIRYEEHWIIKDPRCREIIREKFELRTDFLSGKWYCSYWSNPMADPEYECDGKNIEEAEIACIKAVYEAEK